MLLKCVNVVKMQEKLDQHSAQTAYLRRRSAVIR